MRVAILAGGVSNERTVSLESGRQVRAALEEKGHVCETIDPQDGLGAARRLAEGGFDVAFIALHGIGGEDGSIQGMCERLGIPYTGSGVRASAIAMDKNCSKIMYRSAGIPVAASMLLRADEPVDVDEIVSVVGEKCVIKPNTEGSSVGMSIVHEPAELQAALKTGFDVKNEVLVERFVSGTEITIAVLGNDDLEVLPIIEIVPHAEFYDYEVKYSPTGADHIIPARIDPVAYKAAQGYAAAAHRALGCRGMSRSDFIVTDDGECIILETNTIPGMTPTSLLPDTARHAGYEFGDLCEKIMGFALER